MEGDIWKRTNGEGGDVRVKGRGKYRGRRSYWQRKRKDLNKTCERREECHNNRTISVIKMIIRRKSA